MLTAAAFELRLVVADVERAPSCCGDPRGRAVIGDDIVEPRPGPHLPLVGDPEGNFIELLQYDDVRAHRRARP